MLKIFHCRLMIPSKIKHLKKSQQYSEYLNWTSVCIGPLLANSSDIASNSKDNGKLDRFSSSNVVRLSSVHKELFSDTSKVKTLPPMVKTWKIVLLI